MLDILDFIPTGKDKAVSRKYLTDATGLSDREIRSMISEAREKIPIINLQGGDGYYIPDMNKREERKELKEFVLQERSRSRSIVKSLKAAEKTLRNCRIEI